MTDTPTTTHPIATCSYKAFRPHMGVPIQGSRGAPKFWSTPIPQHQKFMELAPGRAYYNAPWAEFNRRYLAQLDEYGLTYLTERFNNIAAAAEAPPDTRLVVLCFEAVPSWDSDACHRALFRHWWARRTGDVIPELSLDGGEATLFDIPPV